MTKEELCTLFTEKFNYDRFVPFCRDVLGIPLDKVAQALTLGQPIEYGDKDEVLDARVVAGIQRNSNKVGVLVYKLSSKTTLTRPIGLRKLVEPLVRYDFEAVIAVFVSSEDWRLSFVENVPNAQNVSRNARRYTYVFGHSEELYRTPIENFLTLQAKADKSCEDIKEAFSVEALSKAFYQELYNWYLWALSPEAGITFPNIVGTIQDDRENLNVKIIRLITRILFMWFIKRKGFIPASLFDTKQLQGIIKDFDANSWESGSYYNAILQNLFFATLNHEVIEKETGASRCFAKRKERDLRNLYRYAEMFSISEEEVIALFHPIPFLNGGLFDCLDKFERTDLCEADCYADGFSRNATIKDGHYKYRAFIPNALFFASDAERQITTTEGSVRVIVPGLFNILGRYNFTIEENSATDEQVALDPELLGRVFENLLASYNEETQTSARKSSGAFYTPRVIVSHMVNESLAAYVKSACPQYSPDDIHALFMQNQVPTEWDAVDKSAIIDALKKIRILDPACGSGAFPLGCLTRMVEVITLLLGEVAIDRFHLKLDLLKHCIFGIDIQPIAMLICRLRCFISLICDQPEPNLSIPERNYGINTLPNLETRFVAANSLISAKIRKLEQSSTSEATLQLVEQSTLTPLYNQLRELREAHLAAQSPYRKQRIKEKDAKTCQLIYDETTRLYQSATTNLSHYQQELTRLQEELSKVADEKWESVENPASDDFFRETQDALTLRVDRNASERNKILKKIATLKKVIARAKVAATGSQLDEAIREFTEWSPYNQNTFAPFFDAQAMFLVQGGFDIVIGNPPYISTKGVTEEDGKKYVSEFGFTDDTYNLFFVKGVSLLKPNGILSYITPKTYWSTQTKHSLRKLILSKTLLYLYDTANPFEAAMVDTCITAFQNTPPPPHHTFAYLDCSKDFHRPIVYTATQADYCDGLNSVIFPPTPYNLAIFRKYGPIVKDLYCKWWDKIKTSRDIEKNRAELEAYRASLKPGDVALLGCLTEGGQGLATADNGRYIAIRTSSKWADNTRKARIKKLKELLKAHKIKSEDLDGLSPEVFLATLSEHQIAERFDGLKAKYGIKVFGKGFIFRLIDDSEIADVDTLTEDEKLNGIDASSGKPFYVPYDKGDKDGNRWFLETPFAIAWTKENVHCLKTDPAARYQGYAFYFREGFCWNNVLTTFIRCRLKQKTVQSTESMSFFSESINAPVRYLVAIMNSSFVAYYVDAFVNGTSHCTTGDAKLIPVVIPNEIELKTIVSYVNQLVSAKSTFDKTESDIGVLEARCETLIASLYGIKIKDKQV